jgi:hypothetical protein
MEVKMDKKSALVINLSQEELLVVMAYLGAKKLLGFNYSVSENTTAEEYQSSMKTAERDLIARGFLVQGENQQFKLNDIVFAIVGACASPEQTLLIHKVYPQKPSEDYWFHQSRKMFVLHTIPMTYIHQFISFGGIKALLTSAFSVLEIQGSKTLSYPSAKIKEGILIKVRNLLQEGKIDLAKSYFIEAGWKDPTLTMFLSSMQNPVFSCTISHIIHHPDGDGDIHAFSLLQSKNGLWKFVSEGDQINVMSSDSEEIFKLISNMLSENQID